MNSNGKPPEAASKLDKVIEELSNNSEKAAKESSVLAQEFQERVGNGEHKPSAQEPIAETRTHDELVQLHKRLERTADIVETLKAIVKKRFFGTDIFPLTLLEENAEKRNSDMRFRFQATLDRGVDNRRGKYFLKQMENLEKALLPEDPSPDQQTFSSNVEIQQKCWEALQKLYQDEEDVGANSKEVGRLDAAKDLPFTGDWDEFKGGTEKHVSSATFKELDEQSQFRILGFGLRSMSPTRWQKVYEDVAKGLELDTVTTRKTNIPFDESMSIHDACKVICSVVELRNDFKMVEQRRNALLDLWPVEQNSDDLINLKKQVDKFNESLETQNWLEPSVRESAATRLDKSNHLLKMFGTKLSKSFAEYWDVSEVENLIPAIAKDPELKTVSEKLNVSDTKTLVKNLFSYWNPQPECIKIFLKLSEKKGKQFSELAEKLIKGKPASELTSGECRYLENGILGANSKYVGQTILKRKGLETWKQFDRLFESKGEFENWRNKVEAFQDPPTESNKPDGSADNDG